MQVNVPSNSNRQLEKVQRHLAITAEVLNIPVDIISPSSNDTHREKLCFTEFSTTMFAWLLLTFLICLRNQLSFIHSIIRIKEYRRLKIVIHQIDSKN